MARVILETPNALDLSVEELTELAGNLRGMDPDLSVYVASQEQRGAGVTFIDVLHFWIPDADFMRDALYGYLIGRCQDALKTRRNRKHQSDRPTSIVVHLPDGTVVEKVTDGVAERNKNSLSDEPARSEPRVIDEDDQPDG